MTISPLSKDEWFQAVFSPNCSKEVITQIKNQKNEVPVESQLKNIESMSHAEQVQAMVELCRKKLDKEQPSTRHQIQINS